MVGNKYMYDKDTLSDAIHKLEELSDCFSTEEFSALYGIVRNHYILQFGSDLKEPLCADDVIFRVLFNRHMKEIQDYLLLRTKTN